MHGDVVHHFLEVFRTRHKVALAVDFEQDSDFASSMNVAGDRSFASHTGSLLGGDRHATLAEQDHCLFQIAFGFSQRLFAVHHWRSGFFPELFHLICGNIHGRCAHC